MFQTYFEVFHLLVGGEELITIEDPSLSVHGYQLLPLATSQYVVIIGNFMFQAYFQVFNPLLLLLMTIDDPSLSAHGYQLLPIATSYLVGNNREFDVSGIF